MGYKVVIAIGCFIGLCVGMAAGPFAAILVAYAAIGGLFVILTKSRGIIADLLFFALWPVYLYADWRSGLLK